MLQCDLHDLSTTEEYLAAIARLRATPIPRCRGSWAAGGPWTRFPGGTPTKDAAGRDRPRSAGLPAEPRRPRRLGELASRSRSAGVTRDTPDPDGRPDRARRAGRALGHPARGRGRPRGAPRARSPPRTSAHAGLLKGQAYLHSLGITAWQDAIVGTRIAGPTTCDTYVPRGDVRRAHGARGGRAVVGPSRGLEQIDDLIAQRTRRPRGPLRRHQRQDHAGRRLRELHGRRRSSPTSTRTARATDNRGHLLRGARAAEAGRDRGSTPRASRCTSTPSRTVPCAEALDAIEAALLTNGPSDAVITSRISRSCTPTTSRGSARWARSRTPQPLWAAHESQMDDAHDPVPRRAPLAAGSTRSAASCARAPSFAMGSDWSVSTPDPLEEIHVAVNRADGARLPARGREPRGVPARGAPRPADRHRGLHDGLRAT